MSCWLIQKCSVKCVNLSIKNLNSSSLILSPEYILIFLMFPHLFLIQWNSRWYGFTNVCINNIAAGTISEFCLNIGINPIFSSPIWSLWSFRVFHCSLLAVYGSSYFMVVHRTPISDVITGRYTYLCFFVIYIYIHSYLLVLFLKLRKIYYNRN